MKHKHIEIKKISSVIDEFEKFMDGEGQKHKEERIEKNRFLDKYFSEDNIEDIDEGVIRELIKKLWAFFSWNNKNYPATEMMKTGMEEIKEGFKILLHDVERPISERFDYVNENIRMMGPAGISEILAHIDTNYAIWNRRALDGLKWLGVESERLAENNLKGSQYEDFCELCREVLQEINQETNLVNDLLELDFLLFYISNNKLDDEDGEESSQKTGLTPKDFAHDAVIEQVTQLGDGLGFEVESEYVVAPGCRIDAIWRSRIANLGTISYAFEVHRKGSRDSAILNLQRVLRLEHSIQKVILVSYKEEIEAFKDEISTLSEDFRNSMCYFRVEDLRESLNHLDTMRDILDDVGLMI
ncbi:hypothetical protein [Halarsenatibacter silvermanii]|uniref:Uncharacterized protein n=1 Tax=Halarsenatibacter silvermanii TaxID=321763 RepID=A0A1G9M439_9FIRM|nr:hypothetical protein [Halarsenatibacter silvermanii]SDL68914.1 hypothetical protein SAMN04488692_10799 [Halarsenatibacter silvermanii]